MFVPFESLPLESKIWIYQSSRKFSDDEVQDIENDFQEHFEHFYNSKDLRTCKECGTIMETDPKFVTKV